MHKSAVSRGIGCLHDSGRRRLFAQSSKEKTWEGDEDHTGQTGSQMMEVISGRTLAAENSFCSPEDGKDGEISLSSREGA